MSATVTFYYGLKFASDDIKEIFYKDVEIPENFEETEYDFDNSLYLQEFFDYESKFNITNNIKVIITGFENTVDDEEADGDSKLFIGIKISKKLGCHYNGMFNVPQITDDNINDFQTFLDENPAIKTLEPELYIYLNQNK